MILVKNLTDEIKLKTKNIVLVSDELFFLKLCKLGVRVIFPTALNAAWLPLPVDVWTANTTHHLW